MKIVFFGTPPFSAAHLDYLITHGVDVAAVVTKPDKPKGRSGEPAPTAVKALVQQKYPNIPLFQPSLISAPGESDVLLPFHADLFVVVAYGEIIKQHLLDMPRLGCINVHTSLLPKYRGAAPIQRAIIDGEAESGVTVMYMVRKMDAGDIIKMVSIPIEPEATFGEYEQLLCRAGCEALLEVIRSLEKGEAARTPQNHELATLAPKIELEDCEIDWTKDAQNLHNLIRGVNPFPGAWAHATIKGEAKRIKIWRSHVVEGEGAPGTLLDGGKGALIVACGRGALKIVELQPEGKRAMAADEFLRGVPVEALAFTGTR